MYILDCNALKIHNHAIQEWKGTHKMGNSCGKVVELLAILKYSAQSNVTIFFSVYKINTQNASTLRMVKKWGKH